MIRPGSLGDETIMHIRELVTASYGGRNELYAAAEELRDEDLSAICRQLADDLAGNTASLEQIIKIHGQDPAIQESITSALCEEIVKCLRSKYGDEVVLSVAERGQTELRQRYDRAIASTGDSETQAILNIQRKRIEFAERVLRQIARSIKDGDYKA